MLQRLGLALPVCALSVLAVHGQTTSSNVNPGPTAASCSSASPTCAGTPLAVAVQNLLAGSRAHWGIQVTAMNGTPVYGLNETRLFRPASTAKLFTTAAALSLLGQDARFTTAVYGDLDASTGTVNGDLVLVGGGDPSFGTGDDLAPSSTAAPAIPEDLRDLANELLAKGVRRVVGKIVGDDQLFAPEPPPEGWAAEDLVWGYGALPDALAVGDNQLRLLVRPAPATAQQATGGHLPALLQVGQAVPFVHLADDVTTELPRAGKVDFVDVNPVPGHMYDFAVRGEISPGAAGVAEHIALPDPALYAAETLRQLLTQQSVQMTGPTTVMHSPTPVPQPFLFVLRADENCASATAQGPACGADCKMADRPSMLLARHLSAPLVTDVQFTLKTSANLHAEMFLRQLGAQPPCVGATSVAGARRVRAWLLQAGIPDGDFLFYDGSGLSAKDLVTPRAEARLLAFAVTQPWYLPWRAGLPVAGVDGTLAGRFTASPLKGKVFAKTGTLGESRALAGYLRAHSGQELIFSILVDDHEPGGADRSLMDSIVEAIAAND